MKAEQWHRIDELFAEALELEGTARQRFLDGACGGDDALRGEVESMLRFARESKQFLETPAAVDAAVLTTMQTPDTSPRLTTDNARFIPGDVVAGRYRIVGLLGRGGMGEVYRADDLKLSQPVALKFLAESLSRNGAALARFHREVSVARQISHRHVCRVYDIGEHAGMHFLSMEYVRGEELSSLLKRIGRLPIDKAVETARQLCAGLAAIHAAGVLHRDLKPANVMIDERGDVRITDFGVAALAEGVSGREAMVGTPAYMAPEQLAGGELTTRSDIYALGLVLYEAFTGNRPFAAKTLPEIVRDRLGDSTPTHPSDWIADLDPLVERVILRCLEKDPERRPASALQVAAALPGGDPLAAALAAGETPSPQMVAAAVREGSLRPPHATLLLAAVFAGFVVIALLSASTGMHHYLPLELSPDVLRAEAAEIAREAGYGARQDDVASGFHFDGAVIRFVNSTGDDARWERQRRAPLPVAHFWYRRSPRSLVANDYWMVTADDPPTAFSGMVTMRLDTSGRLLAFEAAPPEDDAAAATRAQPVDWARFFVRAGLPMDAFRPAAPRWTPPQHSDMRVSWTGVHPARPDLPLRVEAASYRGAPVWFEIAWPWRTSEREPLNVSGEDNETFGIALLTLYLAAMTIASILAWRNIRLGRGDRRGTFRLALFIFAGRMVFWLFVAHHVATIGEVGMLIAAMGSAVHWAAIIGLLYLALEPVVRRRWPERLISWSRLLTGDFRDPLVGRDILIGCAFGVGVMVANQLHALVQQLLGKPVLKPSGASDLVFSQGLGGVRGFFPLLLNQVSASVMFPLIMLALVLFLAMVTRRNTVAFAVSWVLFYVVLRLNFSDDTPLSFVISAIVPTIWIIVLSRHGLLSMAALFFTVHLWAFYPVTTEVTAWYATTYLMQLALLTGLVLYAYRVSLAGQRVVGRAWLEE